MRNCSIWIKTLNSFKVVRSIDGAATNAGQNPPTDVKKIARILLWLSVTILGTEASMAATESVLRIGGSGTDLATFQLLADKFVEKHPGVHVEIPPSFGSSGGIKALISGRLDIALTSRALNSKEMTMSVQAKMYAKTALVFAVQSDNPVMAVDLGTLLDIYTGNAKHWDNGEAVRPILRPQSDSDTLLLREVYPVLGQALDAAYQRRGVVVAVTDQDSADKIAAVPGALGTSTLSLLLAERRPLKVLAFDGVVPDANSITQGSYRLVKELYFVVENDPSPVAREFLKFVSSPAGVAILQRTGHVAVPFNSDIP